LGDNVVGPEVDDVGFGVDVVGFNVRVVGADVRGVETDDVVGFDVGVVGIDELGNDTGASVGFEVVGANVDEATVFGPSALSSSIPESFFFPGSFPSLLQPTPSNLESTGKFSNLR
jgi:hypothetical protein